MDITFWQFISAWAGRIVLILAVLTALSMYLRRVADSRLKGFYRQQSDKKLDIIDSRLYQISEHTKFVQPIYDSLLQPVGIGTQEEDTLRKSAFDKLKNEEYFDALTDINQAIELAKNNPKNFVVRAYIHDELYDKFHPGWLAGTSEKVREKHADRWYERAVVDYEKVIELAEDKNSEIAIEAKLRLPYLKSKKALNSDERETHDRLFEEAQKDIGALLNQFPNNEKIKRYSKLIEKLASIVEEAEGMIK